MMYAQVGTWLGTYDVSNQAWVVPRWSLLTQLKQDKKKKGKQAMNETNKKTEEANEQTNEKTTRRRRKKGGQKTKQQ